MLGGDLNKMDPLSSPKDVERCLRLKSNACSAKNPLADANDYFVLNPIRWREESFGTVVSTNKKVRVYLDHAGTKLLRQIKNGETYRVDDDRLEWGALQPEKFVAILVGKGVARLVKGGDQNAGSRI